jgi:hypothetical protein
MPIMPGPIGMPRPIGVSPMPIPGCCALNGVAVANNPAVTNATITKFVRFMIDTPRLVFFTRSLALATEC